ncbi:MAG: histidinol-phosphate transaminase [Helicobacteraceae bacterium]|jgi:histidinol-phosphate aminotransferase|nr:histidinol-phosphate transaminase [Helicobacteraceae bacterium]
MPPFKQEIENIKTYEAGKPFELIARDYGVAEDEIVKLASNENPFGTSPKVKAKVAELASKMHRYPDDSYFALKLALAKKFDVKSENIIIGAGSDQIFEFISRALIERGDVILQNKIAFAMYAIYAAQVGGRIIRTDTLRHDLKAFEKLLANNPKVIYICTPSNPYGDALDRDETFEFLGKTDKRTLVVIDAAYMEYAAFKDERKLIEPKELIERFPNAIYAGTFSKAYGLGGMRVGYGIARGDIIEALHKLRPPFNITTLSLAAAIEALGDSAFVQRTIEHNFKEMTRYESFAREIGLTYEPSYANFIAFTFPKGKNASDTANALLKRGMIVRDLKSYDLNALRVTIGLSAENDRFFELFRERWR